MKGITLFGCWAHARRKFTEALDENRALATQALCHIGKLYKVESEADEAGLSIEERKEKRIRESYPVILEFEKWMQDTYLKVLPKSRTGKAIEYTFSLLPRLSRYVNDGRVNIDNNLIENAIRPLALGRKNYLFCGNDASHTERPLYIALSEPASLPELILENGWRTYSGKYHIVKGIKRI